MTSSYLREFDRRESQRHEDNRRRSLRQLSDTYTRSARDVSPAPSPRDDWERHSRRGSLGNAPPFSGSSGSHYGNSHRADPYGSGHPGSGHAGAFYSGSGGFLSGGGAGAGGGGMMPSSSSSRPGSPLHARFDAAHPSNAFAASSGASPSRGSSPYSGRVIGGGAARFEPPPPRVAHDVMSGYYGRGAPQAIGYRGSAPVVAGGAIGPLAPPPPPPTSRALRADVEELADLMLRRKFMRAFEEMYAPDVVMSDNGLHERVGKAECRQFKNRFLESVMQWHDVAVRTIMCDGDKSVIEALFDVTFRSGRRVIQKQALVQTWRDGQIIREVSYHMV